MTVEEARNLLEREEEVTVMVADMGAVAAPGAERPFTGRVTKVDVERMQATITPLPRSGPSLRLDLVD